MDQRRANVLTAVGLLLLLAIVALTAPRWSRALMRSLPSSEEEASGPTPAPSPEEPSAAVERRINVKLFFQSTDRPGLAIEERPVAFSSDLSRQLQSVVEELVRGPRSGLGPTLVPGTRVLHVFVSARGIAYVDLSKEAAQGHPGGSDAELVTIYSVVDSLAANFPAVKRVQILVEDKPAATLAGHIDISRPLPPDMTLLASAPLQPADAAPVTRASAGAAPP